MDVYEQLKDILESYGLPVINDKVRVVRAMAEFTKQTVEEMRASCFKIAEEEYQNAVAANTMSARDHGHAEAAIKIRNAISRLGGK